MSGNPYMDLGGRLGHTLVLGITRVGKTYLPMPSLARGDEQIGNAGLGGDNPHRSSLGGQPSPGRKRSS